MELTNTQKMLLLIFNVTKIRNQEAAALLTLLTEEEGKSIIKQAEKIAQEEDRILTEQELMNILFPILKAKEDVE